MEMEELSTIFPSGKKTIPHSGYDRCCVYKSENQLISNVYEDLIFDLEQYDSNENMHNIEEDKQRIYINVDGFYFVAYHIEIQGNPNVLCESRVMVNGSFEILQDGEDSPTGQAGNTHLHQGNLIRFSASDYLILQAKQNKGIPQEVISASTILTVVRIF
jgi:hypothetical protein